MTTCPDRIVIWKDPMTIREPIVDVLGSTMPACGHLVTTWSDLILICRDPIVGCDSRVASWDRSTAIAGS